MSDNVIAHLRKNSPLSWKDRLEAADEIERLREENARLREETDEWEKSHNTLVKEIERLREENARLRESLKPFVPETQWIDPDIPDTRPIDVMVLAGELRAAIAKARGETGENAG